ncbi:11976_t:CDS:2, partial [Ambispora gerdemannii]
MSDSRKRKPIHKDANSRKKPKGYYKRQSNTTTPVGLKPGISGIFVSCPKDRERLCVRECYNLFNETNPPVDPTNFVHYILSDLYDNKLKKSRFIQRLTPITKACYADMPEIIVLAKEVIGAHFHSQDEITKEEKKNIHYSIVPRIRNNKMIDRTQLIDTLAGIVGKQHTVNLDNPELAVLVEVFKNVCGISVVRDYLKFKKFNLELIPSTDDNLNAESTQ